MAIRLIRQIGAGGMGRVLEGRMELPGGREMPVAVKLPTTDLEDPVKRARDRGGLARELPSPQFGGRLLLGHDLRGPALPGDGAGLRIAGNAAQEE